MDRVNWFLTLYPDEISTTTQGNPDLVLNVTPNPIEKIRELLTHYSAMERHVYLENKFEREITRIIEDPYFSNLLVRNPYNRTQEPINWLRQVLINQVPVFSLTNASIHLPTKELLENLFTQLDMFNIVNI